MAETADNLRFHHAKGNQTKLRTYMSFIHQAGSWDRPRKVVARLECSLRPDRTPDRTSTRRGKDRKMFSKLHLVGAVKTAALVAVVGLALSGAVPTGVAFAGEAFVATSSSGYGNRYTVDAWGNPYVSGVQVGTWNRGRVRAEGYSNTVTHQHGRGNELRTDVSGANDLGVYQNANHAYADVRMSGNGNGAAIYQYRSGSAVMLRSLGDNNQQRISIH
jgi:hypothetical protein